jgi:hypothetical protein
LQAGQRRSRVVGAERRPQSLRHRACARKGPGPGERREPRRRGRSRANTPQTSPRPPPPTHAYAHTYRQTRGRRDGRRGRGGNIRGGETYVFCDRQPTKVAGAMKPARSLGYRKQSPAVTHTHTHTRTRTHTQRPHTGCCWRRCSRPRGTPVTSSSSTKTDMRRWMVDAMRCEHIITGNHVERRPQSLRHRAYTAAVLVGGKHDDRVANAMIMTMIIIGGLRRRR